MKSLLIRPFFQNRQYLLLLVTPFLLGVILMGLPEIVSGQQIDSVAEGISEDELMGSLLLEPVNISPQTYQRPPHYSRYYQLEDKVEIVYPYALAALNQLRELENSIQQMEKKRERKKYRKKLERELKEEFSGELKNLTRSQGEILINMIERQTDRPFYQLLKDIKSPVTAFFWQAFAKTYGYNLKEGYDPNEDPMLEYLLNRLQWPEFTPAESIMRK